MGADNERYGIVFPLIIIALSLTLISLSISSMYDFTVRVEVLPDEYLVLAKQDTGEYKVFEGPTIVRARGFDVLCVLRKSIDVSLAPGVTLADGSRVMVKLSVRGEVNRSLLEQGVGHSICHWSKNVETARRGGYKKLTEELNTILKATLTQVASKYGKAELLTSRGEFTKETLERLKERLQHTQLPLTITDIMIVDIGDAEEWHDWCG